VFHTAEKEGNSNEYAKPKEAADGGIRPPGPDIDDFTAVKSLVDFKIVVGDHLVELPNHLHRVYYDLCQAQKAFVHRNLPKHISPALATQLIVDTANIAEGIKASSPVSIDDLAGWKKTLKIFEHMGMDVSLMRKRVKDLLGLLSALSQTSVLPEGYEVVKLERDRLAKQLRDLKSRVSILTDGLEELDVEMEKMEETSIKNKEQAVRELAAAPW
jgi:hypothetical protein